VNHVCYFIDLQMQQLSNVQATKRKRITENSQVSCDELEARLARAFTETERLVAETEVVNAQIQQMSGNAQNPAFYSLQSGGTDDDTKIVANIRERLRTELITEHDLQRYRELQCTLQEFEKVCLHNRLLNSYSNQIY
jgi:hypothetical protein